jgi:K+-sensing histidine kinase KdpD
VIDRLPTVMVNEPLFCTAIDNLIRNGLKYNDSEFKMVALTMLDDSTLGIIDNGRGMTQEEFERYSKAYTRKEGQKEKGSGLGLNICIAILREHGFSISCQKQEEGGTLIKVRVR